MANRACLPCSVDSWKRIGVTVFSVGLISACLVVAGCGNAEAPEVNLATLGVPGMIRVAEVRTGFVNILPVELKGKLDSREDFTLVDVRWPLQYQAGHLPTAISMPVTTLRLAMNSLDRNKEVVVYCQNGIMSVSACNILVAGGFRDVKNLAGGISAWPYELLAGNAIVVSL